VGSWSTQKKDYCCKERNIGCKVTEVVRESENDQLVMHDCNYDLTDWKARWPLKKSLWCCANWDKGCYDCAAPTPWTRMHRDFCCQGRLEGCDAAISDQQTASAVSNLPTPVPDVLALPEPKHDVVAQFTGGELHKDSQANEAEALAWAEAEKKRLDKPPKQLVLPPPAANDIVKPVGNFGSFGGSDNEEALREAWAAKNKEMYQQPQFPVVRPPAASHDIVATGQEMDSEASAVGNTVAGYWLWVEGTAVTGKGTLPAAPLTPSEWAEDKWGDNVERKEQQEKEQEEEKKKAPGHWIWKGAEAGRPKFPPPRPTVAQVALGKTITKVYNSDVCSETTPMKRSAGLRTFCCLNYGDGCDKSVEAPTLETHDVRVVPSVPESQGRWVWKAATPKPYVPPWYAPWEKESPEAKKARLAAAGIGKWEWTGPQNVPHPGPPASMAPVVNWPQIKAEIHPETSSVLPSKLSAITSGLLILGVVGSWVALRRRPNRTSLLQVESWAAPELE